MTRSLQSSLEELLGRSRVSLSGKPEVDRGAGGIDGTIQVPPVPTLANVRFVDPPGAVGWFQFPPASLVQFGCVALHPAPNGGVVSRETSFDEQRYESENRRYQRTAQTITSGSKCRHLKSAGRGLIMGYTAAYQTRSLVLQHCRVHGHTTSVSVDSLENLRYSDDRRTNHIRLVWIEISGHQVRKVNPDALPQP
jgi:hypothetical protein